MPIDNGVFDSPRENGSSADRRPGGVHRTWGGRGARDNGHAFVVHSVSHGSGDDEDSEDILQASLLDRNGLHQDAHVLSGSKHRMSLAYNALYETASAPIKTGMTTDLENVSSVDLIYGDADALKKHEQLLASVHSAAKDLEEEVVKDILCIAPERLPRFSAEFNSRSTLGISFLGLAVEDTLVGGPAFLSGLVEIGDVLMAIDDVPATLLNKHDLLLGDDVPGTQVRIKFRPKTSDGSQAQYKNVLLTRVSTGEIADRRRMLEFFASLRDQAGNLNHHPLSHNLAQCQALFHQMQEVERLQYAEIRKNADGHASHLSMLVQGLKNSLSDLRLKHIETLTNAADFAIRERVLTSRIKELMSKISAQETMVHLSHREVLLSIQQSKMRLIVNRCRKLKHARAFDRWRDMIRNKRRLRQAASQIVMRFLSRSLWRAIRGWVHAVRATLEGEQLCNGTVELLLRRWKVGSLWGAFQNWSRVLEKDSTKLAEDRKARVLQRLRFDSRSRAFNTMKLLLLRRKRASTLCHKVIRRLLGYLKLYMLERWKILNTRRNRYRNLEVVCLFIGRRVMCMYALRAVGLWRESVIRMRKVRNFVLLWKDRFAAKALHGWLHSCVWRIQRRLRLLKILRQWQFRRMNMALEGWREAGREEHRKRVSCVRILRRWMRHVEGDAFEIWLYKISYDLRVRQKCVTLLYRWQQRSVSQAFLSFEDHACKAKRRRRILLAVVYKLYHHAISKAYSTWLWEAARQVRIRLKVRSVCARLMNQRLTMSFSHWHHQTFQTLKQVRMLTLIIRRWCNNLLLACLRAWTESSHRMRRLKGIGRKIAFRFLNLVMAIAFTSWQQRFYMLKHRLEVLSRVMLRWRNSHLQWAFKGWLSQHAYVLRLKVISTKLILRVMQRGLGIAMSTWVAAVSENRQLGYDAKLGAHRMSRQDNWIKRICLRWQNTSASSAFGAWRDRAIYARILRSRCLKVVFCFCFDHFTQTKRVQVK